MDSIKQWLADYDSGKEVQTVSMGGISYGYEQAIQHLAIEIMRGVSEKEVPENNNDFTEALNNAIEYAEKNLDAKYGFSGAQAGAAANLAAVYWRKTPSVGLDMMRSNNPERIFKMKKDNDSPFLIDYKN